MVDLSSSFFVNVYQRVNLHFPMVFLWFSYGFPMLVKLSGCGLAATHWMEGGGARPLCRQLSIDIAKDRTYLHPVATQMPHICIYHTHICTYVYIYWLVGVPIFMKSSLLSSTVPPHFHSKLVSIPPSPRRRWCWLRARPAALQRPTGSIRRLTNWRSIATTGMYHPAD